LDYNVDAIISNFNHLNLRDDVGKFWENFMVVKRDGKLFGFCDVDRGVILFVLEILFILGKLRHKDHGFNNNYAMENGLV